MYARCYGSDNVSAAEFNRFELWARTRAPASVSCWRTRPADTDSEWYVVVVDDSEDSVSLRFDWHGEPYLLDQQQALAFVERRLSRALAAWDAGARGQITERLHYGAKSAPRLTSEGVWQLPEGGQG